MGSLLSNGRYNTHGFVALTYAKMVSSHNCGPVS